MRVAIIDLGTNTFNLLIAGVEGTHYTLVHQSKQVVKLGEKGINENQISEAAFQRGLQAVQAHAEVVKKHEVQMIKAFATSAIRDAKNGPDFIRQINILTGIQVEIISGDREAELIYYGNRMAVAMGHEPHLIMDIGGGSVEFIIANQDEIFWKQSFPVGVARLLEQFSPEDPVTENTKEKIALFLSQKLQSFLNEIEKYPVKILIGSSGAFESVINMIGKEQVTPKKHNYLINLTDYRDTSRKTIASTAIQREQMPGLIPMRRDMIVLSFLLIDFVLEHTGIKELKVSSYSLKEGILHTLLEKKTNYS